MTPGLWVTLGCCLFSAFVSVTTAICLLIVIEDFGTAVLIGLCAVTILIAGRVKLWQLTLLPT